MFKILQILTDVLGDSVVTGGVAIIALGRHHIDNDFIVGAREEVGDNEAIVTSTTHLLACLNRVDTIIPTDDKASNTSVVLVLSPDHQDGVWSLGSKNDLWWRQRHCTSGRRRCG